MLSLPSPSQTGISVSMSPQDSPDFCLGVISTAFASLVDSSVPHAATAWHSFHVLRERK